MSARTAKKSEASESKAPRSGLRSTPAAAEAVVARWPETARERFELFDFWARQVNRLLHSLKSSYRLMAVIRLRIMWQTGEITATNRMLADDAGGWDEKTIQREVTLLRGAGYLSAEYGGRKNADGMLVKTRILRLAFPSAGAHPTGQAWSGRAKGATGQAWSTPTGQAWSDTSCTPEQEEPTDDLF